MASFNNNILDIPGLMPVNIGSSAAYPVPFAPQIKPPQSAPIAQPQAQQQGASGSPMVSGFGGGGIDGTGLTMGGATGDQSFNFGGYSGGIPDFFNYQGYAPDVNPAQLSSLGSVGLGDYGQSIWDRISSLGNEPDFNRDNTVQAGINAAGLFSPFASIGAGVLQGFNELEPGFRTGNALGDVAGTPGVLQQTTADIVNWINRQFGGNYMTSSSAPPDASGPSSPNYTGVPYDASFDARYTPSPTPAPSNPLQAAQDYISNYQFPPNDPYSMSGNMWTDFMQGATFGGGRFDGIGGGGGGFGGGGFGSSFGQPSGSPDNNGGWGQ